MIHTTDPLIHRLEHEHLMFADMGHLNSSDTSNHKGTISESSHPTVRARSAVTYHNAEDFWIRSLPHMLIPDISLPIEVIFQKGRLRNKTLDLDGTISYRLFSDEGRLLKNRRRHWLCPQCSNCQAHNLVTTAWNQEAKVAFPMKRTSVESSCCSGEYELGTVVSK